MHTHTHTHTHIHTCIHTYIHTHTHKQGYIQRRLIKAMEDVMCKYDGTVRDSGGQVIQFLYGEDGMDGAHMEKQTLVGLGKTSKVYYLLNSFESKLFKIPKGEAIF